MFNYYQQPMQTPMQPYRQQQAQMQDTGPNWLYVPTIADVQNVSVMPGGKAWIMVQNECVFAFRSADNMGVTATDYYRFERIDPSAMSRPQGDYVTRAEFEQLVKLVKGESE